MIQKECSDETSSDNLAVMLYSDESSDAPSDSDVVTLYSVVMNSDVLYSSNRGLSLYSVVIRESCEL